MRNKLYKSSLALLALLTVGGSAPLATTHAATFFGSHMFVPKHIRHHRIRRVRHYQMNIYKNRRLIRQQARYQENKRFMRKFRRDLNRVIRQNRRAVMREPVQRDNSSYTNSRWFKDGLSKQNLRARNWVSWHESSHRWDVLSYGGVCIGYFQLDPGYLGYRHGHVNLNHKHQVQVADAYVKIRYGSWVRAQRFWEAHSWY